MAGGVTVGIKESGRPDMGVLCVAPEWRGSAASAAVFTTNSFAAAPVILNKEECDLEHFLALIVNSGNAIACTGPHGLIAARAMRESCAAGLGVAPESVAVASTGIIGVPLDPAIVAKGADKAAAAISSEGGGDFSRSIMTTDRYEKQCAVEVTLSAGAIRIGACAKGAGMISPALATMICAVTTDAVLDPGAATTLLEEGVAATFNRVTVDGEMSTNDSVFLLAGGASGIAPVGEDLARVAEAMKAVLLRLALMMVADGEGATKVIRITVTGTKSPAEAARVARAVGDSTLVKTAMHGGDPNWGRIISSAGAALPGRSFPHTRMWLAGVKVVEAGAAADVSAQDRSLLAAAMKEPEIEILLDLGEGAGEAIIYFSDLGHEYITINAEYHS